jgi:hypothetical protein
MRRESASEREAWTREIEKREGSQPAAPAPQPLTAHGRQRVEKKNKTEMAYEAHLNLRKITGEVVWFQFEGITFKLGPDCRYTPDFPVMLTDGTLEIHEIKGTEKRKNLNGEGYSVPRFEDDARAKIAVAASMFPFVFKVVYKVDGNWIEKEV